MRRWRGGWGWAEVGFVEVEAEEEEDVDEGADEEVALRRSMSAGMRYESVWSSPSTSWQSSK